MLALLLFPVLHWCYKNTTNFQKITFKQRLCF
jgi:hypothetical protein